MIWILMLGVLLVVAFKITVLTIIWVFVGPMLWDKLKEYYKEESK